mmetsp:Transcript_20299/g.61166  ORF Transcript_20299/g.61166 Transcript_20299/m.61166 type:complete len:212 (+) Transcript_20299:1362-1997(+)
MFCCCRRADLASHIVAQPHQEGHLKFEVNVGTGLLRRRSACLCWRHLACGPPNRSARWHNRGGASVVGHRQVQPVWCQGVLFIAKHGAHAGGVLPGCVEVCVVPNGCRHQHLHLFLCKNSGLSEGCVGQAALRVRQKILHGSSRLAPCGPPLSHECVQTALMKTRLVNNGVAAFEASLFRQNRSIQHAVSDRQPHTRSAVRRCMGVPSPLR